MAVVTGAASGIGRAAAFGLTEVGAAVLALNRDEAGGSCNINTPEQMRAMVGDGAATFFASCRQSLDDPDFPRKIAEGREDEIRKSTRTGASLLQSNIFGKGVAGSAQNPAFGRDREYRLVPTLRPKRVLVAGGGSGGMEYALTAHEIGHKVALFGQVQELGGAMRWAGNYSNLRNMEQIGYQPDWHRRMIAKHGVDVRLGEPLTVQRILAERPDVVVVATGARAALPDVAGLSTALDSGFARTIDRVLDEGVDTLADGPLVIWGASEGVELALDLVRGGRRVRLLDSADKFAPAAHIGSRARYVMLWAAQAELAAETGVELVEVVGGELQLRHGDGREEVTSCANLVLAPGRAAHDPLSDKLIGTGIEVQVIGDARSPRSYGNAIHEAAYLARRI